MMYRRVGEAIKLAGLDSHPTDWLLFLCPGKREPAGPWLDQLEPATEAMAKTMRRTLRGPIYVHSKMLIKWAPFLILPAARGNTQQTFFCWSKNGEEKEDSVETCTDGDTKCGNATSES